MKNIFYLFFFIILISSVLIFVLYKSSYFKIRPAQQEIASQTPSSGEETTQDSDQNSDQIKNNNLEIIGWIPYWDQENAFDSFKDNIELFSFVSVFWYYLDPEGNIKLYTSANEDKNIVDFAHKNGVKVLAAITNLPDYLEGGNWDQKRVEKIISSPSLRKKHISDIVELIQKNNYDGIDIDYEALKNTDRNNFSIFIKELSQTLHAENKLLGVAIHPKTSENNPKENNGSHAQDWKTLYPLIDHVYFMLYSEHSLNSNPGPNASVEWIDKILNYAVNSVKVPREKIFFGIPFYGHEWMKIKKDQYRGIESDVTFEKVYKLSKEMNLRIKWDEASKTPYFTYMKNGKEHVIWFENNESFKAKLSLAEKYQIFNFAFWRLGGEDLEVWKTIKPF